MNEKLFYSLLSCYCKKTLNLSADNKHNEIKLDPVKLLIISGSYIYFLFAQEKTIYSLFPTAGSLYKTKYFSNLFIFTGS